MATSSTYAVTKTGYDIAKAISRLAANEPNPKPGEVEDILEAVNDILFQIAEMPNQFKPGEMLWQRETVNLTLSSKAVYSLKPSGGDCDIQIPIEILTATLKDTDSNEIPMESMDLYQYQAISNKSETGSPSRFYYERRLDEGKLYLDFIPSDTTDVIDLVYRQPLEIITAKTQTFDIASYFFRWLKYAGAVDVGPEFSTPADQFQKNVMLRDEAWAMLNMAHPENSDAYFQPEIDE